jgi:UDP-N-acetylmuramoylalanine--D-glutamate ligase
MIQVKEKRDGKDFRIPPIVINKNEHVVIVGLGKSGLSAAKFCLQQGARVTVSDAARLDKLDPQRCRELERIGVFLESGGHSRELFETADLILVSPGVPLNTKMLIEARLRNIPVVGEMSLAAHYLRTPMLAVTGTNGKTTVTSLLGEIFAACGKKVFVGGNIGTPLTDYLAGPQEMDAVILEISSFQLDTAINLKPRVAVLLNITEDHLDRYESLQDYALSKFSIFKNQNKTDISIINADDDESRRYLENTTSLRHGWEVRSVLFYGKSGTFKKGAVLRVKKVKLVLDGTSQKEEIFNLAGTRLSESPNLENSAAAILASAVMGCDTEGIRKGLANFNPLAHRFELVAAIGGVAYVDDSKATNVGAVKSALDSVQGNIVLIAGGRDKGGDYSPMAKGIAQKVKALLLIGEAKERMAAAFHGLTKIEMVDSLEDAVFMARDMAVSGDTVLLSPACASFDMFESYAARGHCFADSVRKLTVLKKSL